MSLKMNSAPYQRSRRTTLQIMVELTIALLLVWIAAVIFYFTKSTELGLRAILLMVVALFTTALIDAGVALIKHKKGQNLLNEVLDSVIHNYSFVTAIIFTLCCPVYVTYYVIIIGCLFSTGIKHCFGGFGKNIFNPAIIGRIVTGVAFSDAFNISNISKANIKLLGSATVTADYSGLGVKWLSDVLPGKFDLTTLLIGDYVGAMGETFTILILVLGIVLAIRGVINWRSTVFYLGTVALSALCIGIFTEGLNPLTYTVYHLALGGLMFGAVFMITDPVTSPTSPFGKALIGVIAGLITVLIRIDGINPEGVMYSIALVNIIAPLIDRLVVGRTTDGHAKKWATIGGVVAASMVLNTALASYNVKAAEKENTPSEPEVVLTDEQKLFGEDGTYTEKTFAPLATDSIIKKVYVAAEKGLDTSICYRVEHTYIINAGGYEKPVNAVIGVSFDIITNKVADIKALDGSAGNPADYSNSAINAVKTFVTDKVASDIAFVNWDEQFELPADVNTASTTTGAIYSSNGVLKAVVESAKQYVVDRPVYLFGNSEATYTPFEMTDSATNILEAYTYSLEGVNYVGYFGHSSKEVEIQYVGTFAPYVAVSINTSNDTVKSIKMITNGGTEGAYASTAQGYLNTKVDLPIGDLINTVGSTVHQEDGTIGATFSVQGIHDFVVDVCKQYINNDKANLVGGAPNE